MYHKFLPAAALACLLMTGCVDSNYDLSDIDTTSELRVDNLTLPINVDTMRIDDVFDIEDSDNFKIVDVNGDRFYALSETGKFHSDPVRIEAIHIDAPHINPTETGVDVSESRRRRAPIIKLAIPSTSTEFHCFTTDVDEAVLGMEAVRTANTTLTIEASLSGMEMKFATFHNLRFQLPEKMEVTSISAAGGKYDPATGILTIPEYKPTGGHLKITMSVDKIDLTATDLDYDKSKHTLSFTGKLGLDSGDLSFDLAEVGSHPSNLAIRIDYTLSDIDVVALTGEIDYHLQGIDIAPVHITGLPDFLKGEGTDIKIANPQLFLGLNNPVGGDRLYCETGFRIKTRRENSRVPEMTFEPDNKGRIRMGFNKGVDGPYNFLLAPNRKTATILPDFAENLEFLQFTSLSDLLSVPAAYKDQSTLPDYIDIDLMDPCIPSQEAVDFPVGRNLPAVDGHYELLAPLGLKEGSIVVYQDTVDGWYDDDLEGLVIDQMVITAKADNDAPVSAQLESYPLTLDGKVIENASVESTVLAAATKNQDITITLKGEIRKLDGLLIRAIMRSSDNETPLKPSQAIVFRDVRVKVNGVYTKEF